MRIESKHIFTHRDTPQKGANTSGLASTFKAKAPMNQSARPLTDRAQLQKSSKEDQKLAKMVQSMAGRIPTPFIKR